MTRSGASPESDLARLLASVFLLGAVTLFGAGSAFGQAEVTFHLVPEAAWNEGRPRWEAFLPEGTVFLYRQGSYEPALEAALGEPVVVPAGSWSWIGEAPGYVTTVGASFSVRASAAGEAVPTKNLVWPAVPACGVRLSGDWRGVERLDVVALAAGAVYPIAKPQAGPVRQVPVGPWIVYGVRAGGLTGLGSPQRCAAGETVEVAPPALPPRDRQDLVVHVRVQPGAAVSRLAEAAAVDSAAATGRAAAAASPTASASSAPVEAAVRGSGAGGEVHPPVAAFRAGAHRTFFFRHLPLTAVEVELRHPALRTVRQPLVALGGSAREVAVEMVPRTALELEVDYRPRRPHRRAELELLRCPPDRRIPDDCREVALRPLGEGYGRYRFDALDDGLYLASAQIDDEWVPGLGHDLVLEVTRSSPPLLQPPPVVVEEMEVWGHLLKDDRAVPGEVVLTPRSEGQPVRRAPTGDDLLYRLYYFAQRPDDFARSLLPEELADLEPEELGGLYGWYEIQACGASGHCRSLPVRSFLVGSGRLDLELGEERGLEVTVVDAATGEPLDRVPVLVRGGGREPRLVFHQGDTWWLEPPGGEASPRRTGPDGAARIRGLPPGPVSWVVKHPGYEPARGMATVPASGWAPLPVALVPEDGPGDVELRFPDGAPVAGGAVVAFDSDGRRVSRCSGALSSRGGLRLAEGCLEAAKLVLFHPEARLSVLPADLLAATGRATVDRAPLPPPRLRITAGGSPLPGVPVAVTLDGLTLGPTELLAPLAWFVQPLFYLTDDRGEIVLRGIDPNAPDAPALHLFGRRDALPLTPWRPGETLEIDVTP